MDINNLRVRLCKKIENLPDDLVIEIADYAAFLISRGRFLSHYEDWEEQQWQDFSLAQLFKEDDEVEYTLKDAKEVYKT